ncbi:MAG: tetratricopeptide repeat protein [Candidatus Paceibacterota bacterium]|jgi:tetratricopeptide (TPR) repeat protein
METVHEKKLSTTLGSVFVWLKNKFFNTTTLLVLLLPIFFIPAITVPFIYAKGILTVAIIVISLAVWIIARLKDGVFVIHDKMIALLSSVIVILYVLSAFFSGSPIMSLIAGGFEITTAAFVVGMFVLIFLVASSCNTRTKVFNAYVAFLAAGCIVAIFQIFRLFFPSLSLNAFWNSTANMVGKWNELSVFFGLVTILTMVTLEMIRPRTAIKSILYALLAVSLFFLALVNFSIVWMIVGIFSLIFFVYTIAINRSSDTVVENKIAVTALVVLALSVAFIMFGNRLSERMSGYFNISQLEGRPSWQATLQVSKDSLKENPILGIGPNMFYKEWNLNKPVGVNSTVLWNADFNYGVGLIPSYLVMLGIPAFLAWLAFIVLVLYAGFKAVFARTTDMFAKYLIFVSFISSLYLWLLSILYVPSLVMFVLTFVFTGILISIMYQEKLTRPIVFSAFKSSKATFVSVFLLVVVLLLVVAYGVIVAEKFMAEVYFQKATVSLATNNDLQKAEALLIKAADLSKGDVYYRSLSEVNLLTLSSIVNQAEGSADTKRNQIRAALAAAIVNAQTARDIDPTNYQNWLSLARVYEFVLPLSIEGAYDNAKAGYEKARELNPTNPIIPLYLSRLELSNDNPTKAKEYVTSALQLKSNYTEAIFLLSQIELALDNVKGAISSVEAATLITPNDPTVYFRLGILRYDDKNFEDAASALETAVTLDSNYSNARYFLGLAYSKLGKNNEAIAQFEAVLKLNPDNKDVMQILTNLRAGKAPLSTPTTTTTKTTTKTLPVKEKAGSAL